MKKVILIYGCPCGKQDPTTSNMDVVMFARFKEGYHYDGNIGAAFLEMYDADYFVFKK